MRSASPATPAPRLSAACIPLFAALLAACATHAGDAPAVGVPGIAEDASVPATGEWVMEAGGVLSRPGAGLPLEGATDVVARLGAGRGTELRATAAGDGWAWPREVGLDGKLVLRGPTAGGAPGAALLAGVVMPVDGMGDPAFTTAAAAAWTPDEWSGVQLNAACAWAPADRLRPGTCGAAVSAGYAFNSFAGGWVQYTGEAASGVRSHGLAAGATGALPGGFLVQLYAEQALAGDLSFGVRLARTLGR